MQTILRWLAFGVMLVLLHVIGATSAHAQTATPTPTATATATATTNPFGLLPTPIATPVVADHNSVTWICRVIIGVAADLKDCVWGNEASWFIFASDPSTGGTTSSNRNLIIIPPFNSKSVDFECSWVAEGKRGSSFSGGGEIGESSSFLVGNNQSTGMYDVGTDSAGDHIMSGSDFRRVVVSRTDPAGAWEDWSVLPSGAVLDTLDYPRIKVSAIMLASTTRMSNISGGLACFIHEITFEDLVVATPPANPQFQIPTNTPGPTGSPTPLTCYIGCGEGTPMANNPWATPMPWVSTPQVGTFETIPGATTCYVFIPAFGWGPYTVFGYALGFSWADFELCAQENSVSWILFDINFGVWATGLLLVSAVGVLYSRLK